MALTLMDPAVILYRGSILGTLCVETNGTGPHAALELANVDPTGETTAQLWQYGSDQRIYQYDGTDKPAYCIGLDGAPKATATLYLVNPDPADHTQQWSIDTSVPSIINNPKSVNGSNPGYCMNAAGGGTSPGSAVIIFPNTDTTNVVWSFAIYPQFPKQPTHSS